MMLAEKKKKKKKKHHRASKASQALVLPTTKLASIARCYFSYFTLFYFAFSPTTEPGPRLPTSIHCSKSYEVMNKIDDTFTNLF